MAVEKVTEELAEEVVEQPEGLPIDVEVEGEEEVVEERPQDDFNANLAEGMDERELKDMAMELIEEYKKDKTSRKEWEDAYIKGLDLLGTKYQEVTKPFKGASGVTHPLLAESVTQFQAQAYKELVPSDGPVRTQVIGLQTPATEQQADRVKDYMNYLLMEEMEDYTTDMDQMLFYLPLSGSTFKKIYYDAMLDRPVSKFIPAEDLVVAYGSSDITTASRVTHIMRKTENEVKFLQVNGFYSSIDLGDPGFVRTSIQKKKDEVEGVDISEDDRYELLEMHVEYDLGEDPNQIALPYVITIERNSMQILSIYRNWKENDDLKRKRNHFVHYTYIPGFGFYGFGLIHLLGGHAKSGTSLLRQLVDAGTLNNLPGGLKTRGLRIKGDDTPIMPGEFRDVDVPGGKILDNITFLPYKEPSQTLLALFQNIVDQGRSMAAISDFKSVDLNSEAPVGTTLAILERMLKVMSAVQARMHNTMKMEFKLLKNIIADHTSEEYEYDADDEAIKREDYNEVEVIPVSDPNASTMSMRVVQYQAALQLAQQAPQLYDLPLLHQQMLQTLGIKDAQKLVPTAEDMTPKDPVSENMALMTGKPVKAFLYQDHEAHIQTHMSAMQNPQIQQLIGQNPMARAIQGALMSHISEHVAMQYRAEVEKQMGVPLSKPDEKMPEDVEKEVSKLMAQASIQVQQQSTAKMAQQQAQQAAQDPIVQMQQQELALKQAELQQKTQKDFVDAALKNEKIEADKAIAGAKLGVELAKQDKELTEKQKLEGVKLGLDIARSTDDMPPGQ